MRIHQLAAQLQTEQTRWRADGGIELPAEDLAALAADASVRYIEGDVGPATGNVAFDGDLVVKGSVGQQYSVQGGGHVLIGNRVEAGARISAKQDLIVCGRVTGRQTHLMALGHFFAQSVHEATVLCSKDLWIGDSLSYANARAGGRLKMRRSSSIKGGEVWALNEIAVGIAGSQGHESTLLTAGIDPVRARRLDDIDTKLTETNRHIVHQLHRFNLERLDVARIKQILASTHGPQHTLLANAACSLGKIVKAQQALLVQRRALLQEALDLADRSSAIRVATTVHPGVELRLGEYTRRVHEQLHSLTVRLDGDSMQEQAE